MPRSKAKSFELRIKHKGGKRTFIKTAEFNEMVEMLIADTISDPHATYGRKGTPKGC